MLPVALILFLQWPLRDFVRAYSREANDLGQWIFALYVSLALTFATRERMPSMPSPMATASVCAG